MQDANGAYLSGLSAVHLRMALPFLTGKQEREQEREHLPRALYKSLVTLHYVSGALLRLCLCVSCAAGVY